MAGRVENRDPTHPDIEEVIAGYRGLIAATRARGANAVEIDGQVFTLDQLDGIVEDILKFGDAEFYQYEVFGWNVTEAINIVSDGRAPNSAYPLTPQLVAVGRVDNPDSEERIARADLSIPGIAVPYYQDGQRGLIVIDAWHRINKAYREGWKEYPVHVLTWEEAKRIRMSGCPWELQDRQHEAAV